MYAGGPALLTTGNPAKRIIFFSLPLLAGEILQIFYTMADAFVVGRWVGINGLAAVGATYNLISFVWGFIIGLTGGFGVITTQRVGAGNEQRIRCSVATSLLLWLISTIILTSLLIPLTPYILFLLQTPDEIMKDASSYVLIIFSGTGIFVFGNMLAAIIYAGGNSFAPMIFFTISTISNIILNILFVVGFSWGIPGAALATVIAQIIALVLIVNFLLKKFRSFIPKRQEWRIEWHEIKIHLSLGIVMGLQRSIVEFGNIMVQTAINGLGALTIASVSVAQRVRGLNMMPLFAISRAVTTYTAQNYGAGKIDRIYKGLFQSCIISLGLGLFMATINQFIGGPIVSLFLRDSLEGIALARQYVLITGYTVFILGIMLVFRSVLQGLGKKTAPILCSIMETVMSILAAFVLIPSLGFIGICIVNPLSWLASGIPLYIAFGILKKRLNNEF